MIRTLIRRVVQAAIDQAVEQWLREVGPSISVVRVMRDRRRALAAEANERAAAAAAVLGLEDEESSGTPAIAPEARVTAPADGGDELTAWLIPALEGQATWADAPPAGARPPPARETRS